jgi:hypothetical protein
MATPRIPPALRKLVRQRAGDRCEYCRASASLSGLECEIDHILPRARGGATAPDNLCLACAACNDFKGSRTHAPDPLSGEPVALFNPRWQVWREHFAWGDGGALVIGLTPCGRATVEALRLNRPLAVAARAHWSHAGRHPPPD